MISNTPVARPDKQRRQPPDSTAPLNISNVVT